MAKIRKVIKQYKRNSTSIKEVKRDFSGVFRMAMRAIGYKVTNPCFNSRYCLCINKDCPECVLTTKVERKNNVNKETN